jgi:hypothetical protein
MVTEPNFPGSLFQEIGKARASSHLYNPILDLLDVLLAKEQQTFE